MKATPTVTRDHLLRVRFRRHELDRPAGTGRARLPALVDYGIQDTGPDGAAWALAIRGAPPGHDGLALAWTLRGAPHAYRRDHIEAIMTATAPYSEDDASKRVFDAAKPIKAAGLSVLDAMRTVAEQQRKITTKPTVKGEVSRLLAGNVDAPFLRYCRVCKATHLYEQMFRLPALQGGLVLDWGTSPPVMRRLTKVKPPLFRSLAGEARDRFDVIRNHLRFYPGARVRDVAEFVDAPIKTIKAHWPADAVEVEVKGDRGARREPRFVLETDVDTLKPERRPPTLRLLGTYDPFVQLRDRELLVDTQAGRKKLWPVIGRPGAIVVDGEVVATWRPKTAGGSLTIRTERWSDFTKAMSKALDEQAERLAAFRGVTLASVEG